MPIPTIISIEGNIGAGKTTIISNLENYILSKYNNEIIFLREPISVWNTIKDSNGTILEKFYKDNEKYAFAFQVMAFATRTENIKNAIKNNPNCKVIICERSLEADKNVFAKMLKDAGKIEDIQYQIYEHFYNATRGEIDTNAVVYINTNTKKCLERINKRSRDGENNISIDYLNNCKLYHDNWLINNDKIDVLNLDTSMDTNYNINNENDCGVMWLKEIEKFILKKN